MDPDLSVSKRSKASLISCFCSSLRSVRLPSDEQSSRTGERGVKSACVAVVPVLCVFSRAAPRVLLPVFFFGLNRGARPYSSLPLNTAAAAAASEQRSGDRKQQEAQVQRILLCQHGLTWT